MPPLTTDQSMFAFAVCLVALFPFAVLGTWIWAWGLVETRPIVRYVDVYADRGEGEGW